MNRNSIVTIPKYDKTPTYNPSSNINGPNILLRIKAYQIRKNSQIYWKRQVTQFGSQRYRFPEVGCKGTHATTSLPYKMLYIQWRVDCSHKIYATGTVITFKNRASLKTFNEKVRRLQPPQIYAKEIQWKNSWNVKYTLQKRAENLQVEKKLCIKADKGQRKQQTPKNNNKNTSFTPNMMRMTHTALYQEASSARINVKFRWHSQNGHNGHWNAVKNYGEAPLTTIKSNQRRTCAAASAANTYFCV